MFSQRKNVISKTKWKLPTQQRSMWDPADSESCKRNAAAAEAVCCAPTPAALNPVAYICPRANVSTELNLTKQTYGFEPQLNLIAKLSV